MTDALSYTSEGAKSKRLKASVERKAPSEDERQSMNSTQSELRRIVVQDMSKKGNGEKKVFTFSGEKVIGNGAFGVVYQTKILELGETVAIKRVFQDKRYKNREFQILKMLDHQNVIKMKYAYMTNGETDRDVYLNVVMDFFPETLYQAQQAYVRKGQLITNHIAKLFAYQMFRGLSYIHALGICHRDIKPQNILVDNSSLLLKICDFGSAKQLLQGETNISYICSRYYRAPELIFGKTNYSTAVDVWSIGCVIAELFLEDPIFPGDSNADQLIEIIKILGSPNQQDVKAMNPNLKDFKMPMIKPHAWKKVFKPEVDPLVIDLVSKVLVYDPEKRLHPLEALLHPYFDELRNKSFSVPGKSIPELFNFSKEELSLKPELAPKLIPNWYYAN